MPHPGPAIRHPDPDPGLPGRSLVDTTDVEVARDTLYRTFLPHRFEPVGGQPFRLRHQKFTLDSMSFNDICYGAESHVAAPKLDAFYCIQLSLWNTCLIEQRDERIRVPAGSLCLLDARYALKQIHPPGYRQMNVRVDRPLLEDFLRQELGRPLKAPIEFARQAFPVTGAAAPLFRLMRYICGDYARTTARQPNRIVARCLERSLLATLLTTLPNNCHTELNSGASNDPAALLRAERFMDEQLSDALSVADLARASGVSVRSLYYAFARHRGQTPMEALKSRRLEHARGLLRGARQQGLTVADIAYRCGFNHPSKFARDYRERFGELPRQTLGRG